MSDHETMAKLSSEDQFTRAGTLVPEPYERRAPGMGVIAAGVEVVEVHECLRCGALVPEWSIDRHAAWHEDASNNGSYGDPA